MKHDPNFQHDMFQMLHKPLRQLDQLEGGGFLERFLLGAQQIFEDSQAKIGTLKDVLNPAKTPKPQYLKDHVGFTKELNNITNDLSDNDLRKLIQLGVALWKQKGIEPGYANIVRLFTGKSARIFNWFDFRLIVGEKAFGEEQLGEDSWLISVPGVEASGDAVNTVVSLLTFEGNALDRSLSRNHGTVHQPVDFYLTPNAGFPQGSTRYARFSGGVVVVPASAKYALDGDFAVEAFVRTTTTAGQRSIIRLQDGAGKGLKIEIDTTANTVSFTLNDGVVTVTETLAVVANLDDGQLRHIALSVKRGVGAKLWVGGTEATGLVPLGLLGDLTNLGTLVLGGEAVGVNPWFGDMDNFRLCLNAAYNVNGATVIPPLTGFIEFQEEALDEYHTDIRIVDEGDLNKPLILRILNLMRPSSERLNIVFIRFFDDFVDGIGQFNILAGSAFGNNDTQMEIQPNSIVATDVLDDTEFRDIVLQVKANDKAATGGVMSVLFFVQDSTNYYEYRVDTVSRIFSLWKWVAGVATQIGADKTGDVVPQASYVFTVSTSFDPATNQTKIQTYFDSNKMHDVIDGAFNEGKFGMKTGTATMQIDEIEMMQLPVDVQKIGPNFNL